MDAQAALKAAEEYRNNGQSDQAVKILLRAIQTNPKNAALYSVVAYDFELIGKKEESRNYAERAVKLEPNVAQYRNNLSCMFLSGKMFKEAEEHARECIRLDPNYYDGYLALAGSLEGQGRMDEAIEVGNAAIRQNPYRMDGYGASAQVYRAYGDIESSLDIFRQGVKNTQPNVKLAMAAAFTLNFSDQVDEQEVLDATKYHTKIIEQTAKWRNSNFHNDRDPDRRLRIGYVSPDFRIHSVASFIEPILQHRDRDKFHVTLYYRHVHVDSMTHHMKSLADTWRVFFPLAFETQIDMIKRDEIDILVDLSGLTEGNSLDVFARKPAPVQFTMIGYCHTTGIASIDYRLVDERTDPLGAEKYATEKLVRIPGSFLVYQIQRQAPEVGPLPALENGHITFGSFNQIAKLSPSTIRAWSRVMAGVPGSRMVLKSYGLDVQHAVRRIHELFEENGISADRVECRNAKDSLAEHLGSYNEIDIALDTFPYHGTTTSCEALSMGVPVVTHYGEFHRSRVGLSLLTSLGHPEWAGASEEEFVRIAVDLASDLSRLAEIRAGLRDQLANSRLCDGEAHCRELETIYREAWTKWCNEYVLPTE